MDKYISELISLVKNNDNWKTLLKENPYNLKTIKECSWHKNDDRDFVGSITMYALDTNGMIAELTKKLNDEKVNLVGLVAKKRENNKVLVTIQINIKDKLELDNLINKLKQLSFAIDVYRTAQ